MKMGVMASLSEIIDYDTAALVAMELGCKVEKEVVVTIEEKLIDTTEDKRRTQPRAPPWWWSWATSTTVRPPSLTISSATPTWSPARRAASPSNIGAYCGGRQGQPGYWTPRPRGLHCYVRPRRHDHQRRSHPGGGRRRRIMPQTVESINHAKAAEIPIIVAINK